MVGWARMRGARALWFVLATMLLLLAGAENARLLLARAEIHGWAATPTEINDPAAVGRYIPVYRPEEIAEVRREILPAAGVRPGDDATARLETLATYLLDRARAARGVPSPRMAAATPLEQFRLGESLQDGLWCANYATILALFLNAADVPARVVMVTTGRPADELDHTFVEAWIPERGGWVFTDPQADRIWIGERGGRRLDVLSVFDALRRGRDGELVAAVYSGGSVEIRPFVAVNDSERTYFTAETYFEYRLAPRHVGFTPVERLRQWIFDDRVHFALREPGIPMLRKDAALAALPGLTVLWILAGVSVAFGRRRSGAVPVTA